MTLEEAFLWLIIILLALVVAVWLVRREIGSPRTYVLQKEVNLRLTYKRYMEIYPSTRVTYEQYKRMQASGAYRKAVSSTKIKRMVR